MEVTPVNTQNGDVLIIRVGSCIKPNHVQEQ